MNLRILRVLLKKEALMMRRNPIVPRLVMIMPLMVMLVIPLVANLDVKNVNVAVVDNDRSVLSRRITADIDASESLIVTDVSDSHAKAMEHIRIGAADVLLTIPYDYSKNLANGHSPKLDLESNGVNATKGALGSRYTMQSVVATLQQWQAEQGIVVNANPVNVLYLYNPTLDFRNYMIPALIVVLIIIICGFLPTLNLVGEKESGSIEAMNVTPIGKFTFVLSKLIPYWVVGLVVVTVGLIIGRLVYGLAPVGNLGAVYLATILFSLVMSGLGVIIANKSNTVMQSIFIMFAFIMIFQLMGGLFTPISSMPDWAQYITYAVPPRYLIEIMRAVYLKGATVADLWVQYTCLASIAAGLCIVAAATYRKQS